MLKIAILLRSDGWGGLEMNTIELAKIISSLKREVLFITHKNSAICNRLISELFEIDYLSGKSRKYFDFKLAKQLSAILRKHNCMHILVVDNHDTDLVAVCKRFYLPKLNFVYQQHMDVGIAKRGLLHTLRFNTINVWIAPLKNQKDKVLALTRIKASKVKVINIGTQIHHLVGYKYDFKLVRNRFNIPEGKWVFGVMGRITPKKGQLFLIEALSKVLKVIPNAFLVVFGSPTINNTPDNVFYNQIISFTNKNHLAEHVCFVPHNSDIHLFYDMVDCVVIPSENETYGMVCIEAMLKKKPIITNQLGGPNDLLESDKYGWIYRFADMDSFVETILKVFSNSILVDYKVTKAFEYAISTFDKKREATELLKYF